VHARPLLTQRRLQRKSSSNIRTPEKGRAQVYAEQEAARKKVLDERATLLKEAESRMAEVAGAKERVAKELAEALRELSLRGAIAWRSRAGCCRRRRDGRPGERSSMRRGTAWSFLGSAMRFAIHRDQRACRGEAQRDDGTRERNIQVDYSRLSQG